ncbi:hypothetical protein F0562_012907 [Nyssa sinensis]|uniref:Uncharacterized protein n=1 Tax=Nyssa sinensis TaxID=561372 RepID=A0A5J4ZWG8_9ASTE|nr:hypothetical protein F0562_012907 [Nyssa sinensis]
MTRTKLLGTDGSGGGGTIAGAGRGSGRRRRRRCCSDSTTMVNMVMAATDDEGGLHVIAGIAATEGSRLLLHHSCRRGQNVRTASIELTEKPIRRTSNYIQYKNSIYIRSSMGLIKSSFTFVTGTLFGIYVAQNYNVPHIKKLLNTGILIAKHIEENYRKPKKRDEDD